MGIHQAMLDEVAADFIPTLGFQTGIPRPILFALQGCLNGTFCASQLVEQEGDDSAENTADRFHWRRFLARFCQMPNGHLLDFLKVVDRARVVRDLNVRGVQELQQRIPKMIVVFATCFAFDFILGLAVPRYGCVVIHIAPFSRSAIHEHESSLILRELW